MPFIHKLETESKQDAFYCQWYLQQKGFSSNMIYIDFDSNVSNVDLAEIMRDTELDDLINDYVKRGGIVDHLSLNFMLINDLIRSCT